MATVHAIPAGFPQTGEVLDGKYQIEELIGSGGSGFVVAARHLVIGQRVALKFLHQAVAENPEACERLVREARAVARIKSDHVARVLDVSVLPTGAPYMVMELLLGTDLSRLRRARGHFPPSDAVDAVLQAGEAIAEAHAMGIVHRDLKPSNLFVVARPDRSLAIKVLDFGLSKSPERRKKPLTVTGVVAGTPHYMAPEQMQSLKHVDHRADIWSLGVLLYYLVSGTRPYDGKTLLTVWNAIRAGPPPPPHARVPAVPPGLSVVIMRCLERDPARRPQSLAELAQGLAPFASARGQMSVEWIVRALAT
jgi:serine/threonine-protein kinase